MLKGILLSLLLLVPSEQKLTELQNLKADNFLLKAQLNSCMGRINEISLTNEQDKLIEEFRQQFGATKEQEWDWASKSFKEKK